MKHLLPLSLVGLMLVSPIALAQTTDATDTTGETTAETETDGNFSRAIPAGQTTNLTEQEISDYQARLDAAATPQERNVIRQELHQLNQERHLNTVQQTKEIKTQERSLFGKMADDFKDIMSGKAARDAKNKSAEAAATKNQANQGGAKSKGAGSDKGNSGGGKSGGNGGGNGGGKK